LDEEIYVLAKHANLGAEYVERLPVYRRRHFLYLFQKEQEEIEKVHEQARSKNNIRPR